jgi:hypothetical protein
MDLPLEKKDPPSPNRRAVTTAKEGHETVTQDVPRQIRYHHSNGVDQKANKEP